MVTDTKQKHKLISSSFDTILECVSFDGYKEAKLQIETIKAYIDMLETNHELEVQYLIDRIGRLEGMLYDSIRNH